MADKQSRRACVASRLTPCDCSKAFGIIVIAFALSAFLQYDALALGWLGQFFPEGRVGL